MNYALAKQLKDAGFPQTKREGHLLSDIVMENGEHLPGMPDWEGTVYAPTLEELIEACGGDYHDFIIRWRSGDWWATCSIGEMPDIDWCKGETPTEAVAKLWLALNGKEEA